MKPYSFRLSTKFESRVAFLTITIVVCISAICSIPYYLSVRRSTEQNLSDRLSSIAGTAAAMIDGDDYRQISATYDPEALQFKRIKAILRKVQSANHIEPDHIYTLTRERSVTRFGVMLHDRPFSGHTYELRPEMDRTFLQGELVTTQVYRDAHGEWLSAYAPILTAEGAISGLVEVDYDAGYVESIARAKTLELFFWISVNLLILSTAIFWLIRHMFKPLRELIQLIPDTSLEGVSHLNSFAERFSGTDELELLARALALTQARNLSILDSAHEGIVILDNRGVIVRFNRAAELLFQTTGRDAVGLPIDNFVDLRFDSDWLRRSKRAAGIGRTSAGDEFPVEYSLSLIPVVFPKCYTMIIYDITKRVEAARALATSARKYRSIFDNVSDGIFQIDSNGMFITINPAMVAILGYSGKSDLLGHSIVDVVFANPTDGRVILQDCLKSGKLLNCEADWLRTDNSRITVALNLRAETSGIGNLVFEGTVRDISEQKLSEELTRHSQKMESLGRLAGGIAHEFNNLLTIIKLNLSLLKIDINGDVKQKNIVTKIDRAVEFSSSLVGKILSFGRKEDLSPALLHVDEVIGSTLDLISKSIGSNVKVETEFETGLPSVFLDRNSLTQIVMNLSLNACDAMPAGGTIRIKAEKRYLKKRRQRGLVEGCHVILSISDTGIGMDSETKARIFEPFFTTKKNGHGTGLGLSIVYGMLRKQNCHIAVDSREGAGTCFTIYVPAASIASAISAGQVIQSA